MTRQKSFTNFAGNIYDRTVNALQECADLYIHKHKKGYYKFWWNQELDILNEKAISSNKVWKAAGKPPSGPIIQQLKSDKLASKIKIREGKENEKFSYSNGLHDALSEKEGGECWKCWKAKF